MTRYRKNQILKVALPLSFVAGLGAGAYVYLNTIIEDTDKLNTEHLKPIKKMEENKTNISVNPSINSEIVLNKTSKTPKKKIYVSDAQNAQNVHSNLEHSDDTDVIVKEEIPNSQNNRENDEVPLTKADIERLIKEELESQILESEQMTAHDNNDNSKEVYVISKSFLLDDSPYLGNESKDKYNFEKEIDLRVPRELYEDKFSNIYENKDNSKPEDNSISKNNSDIDEDAWFGTPLNDSELNKVYTKAKAKLNSKIKFSYVPITKGNEYSYLSFINSFYFVSLDFDIGRSSTAMPILEKDAKQGDIVYNNKYCGIYTGNGMVIHPSKKGIIKKSKIWKVRKFARYVKVGLHYSYLLGLKKKRLIWKEGAIWAKETKKYSNKDILSMNSTLTKEQVIHNIKLYESQNNINAISRSGKHFGLCQVGKDRAMDIFNKKYRNKYKSFYTYFNKYKKSRKLQEEACSIMYDNGAMSPFKDKLINVYAGIQQGANGKKQIYDYIYNHKKISPKVLKNMFNNLSPLGMSKFGVVKYHKRLKKWFFDKPKNIRKYQDEITRGWIVRNVFFISNPKVLTN